MIQLRIEVKGLSKSYGKAVALQSLDLVLESPALIGLVGPNGAGKSTLMKLLVAQLLPTAGEVLVDGRPLRQNERYLKERLGYLPQDFGLYDELSVTRFLDYMATMKRISPADRQKEITRCIRRVGLEGLERSRIGSLSGGQKQRVGIAQALLGSPTLLIVDEPTVGLDPEERIRFRNLFSDLSDDRIVILSTHIIDDVESIYNRLIVMNEGAIRFDGRPDELVHRTRGKVSQVEGPAGTRWEAPDWAVTSRVVTPEGVRCRIVGDRLPGDGVPVEPSLEDAYLYSLHGGDDNVSR